MNRLQWQDEDKSKAEGPSCDEIERLERMKAELLSIRSSDKSSSPMGSISSNSIGRYSLGPHKIPGFNPQGSRERRKSAGDQDMVQQLNMFVRTRTDSGKRLTDMVSIKFTRIDTKIHFPFKFSSFIRKQNRTRRFFESLVTSSTLKRANSNQAWKQKRYLSSYR